MTTDTRAARNAADDDPEIVPDPSLPPTAVPEELPGAQARTRWTPQKIALWAAISLLGGIAWVMLAVVRR